jgi:hypothetical protein
VTAANTLLQAVEEMSNREAISRYQAKMRVTFAQTLIAPYMREASGDPDALGLLPNHIFTLESFAMVQLKLKSRKIADSFGLALFALAQCATNKNEQVNIGSYDEEEARNKLRYLDGIYSVLPRTVRRELGMTDGSEKRKFHTGSEINFLTRKAPTGSSGSYLGDEFSVEPKGKVSALEILVAALAGTTHKGVIRLTGTLRGEDTLFYQIYSGAYQEEILANPIFAMLPQVQWEIGEFPWWTSPALCTDPVAAAIEAPRLDTPDRVLKYGNDKLKQQFVIYLTTPGLGLPIFQREFELKLVADGEFYYELEEIEACYGGPDYIFEHCEVTAKESAHFVPADEDPTNTVLQEAKECILRLAGHVKRGTLRGEWALAMDKDELVLGHNLPEDRKMCALRLNIGLRDMPFPGKQELIEFAMRHLPISKGNIDSTRGSVGVQLGEWAAKKWPGKLREFQFTPGANADGFTNIKTRFQLNKVLLPRMPRPEAPKIPGVYRDMVIQLRAVKKTETAAGNVLINITRTKDHHGDKAKSFLMLCDLFGTVETYQTGNVIILPQAGRSSASRQLPLPRGPLHQGSRTVIVR